MRALTPKLDDVSPAARAVTDDFTDARPIDMTTDLHLTPRIVCSALLVVAFLRFWYASLVELAPDEALYWVWSHHLAAGYLDHPPMIAYLIALSTKILGSTELGVRFFAVTMSLSAALIVVWLAHR